MRSSFAALVAAALITPEMTVSYLGVPLNVLVACTAGTYCSFSFGDKVEPRAHMFRLFFACIIMGCAVTALSIGLVEHYFKPNMTESIKAGMGAVVAFITRFLWPPIVDALRTGRWIKWLPFVNRKEGE